AFIIGIADVDVAGRVHYHAVGVVEVGRRGEFAVAVVADRAGAGDGDDDAVGQNLADAVGARVGDEDVAEGVGGEGGRLVCHRRGARAVVAAVARGPSAGDGDNDSVGLDLADAVVALVGEVDVAAAIDGHAPRRVDLGRGGGAVVAAVARGPGAGDGDDVAGGLDDLADAVVVRVRDGQVAVC